MQHKVAVNEIDKDFILDITVFVTSGGQLAIPNVDRDVVQFNEEE